jgi:hypothetical protein
MRADDVVRARIEDLGGDLEVDEAGMIHQHKVTP